MNKIYEYNSTLVLEMIELTSTVFNIYSLCQNKPTAQPSVVPGDPKSGRDNKS